MSAPQVIQLQDPSSGDSVSILVSQGFNCFRWTRQLTDDAQASASPSGASATTASDSVLFALPNHESGEARASSGGIPILFPFPGRIPGTQFTWRGKDYQLEASDKFGNAIHGFVHNRPWQLVNASPQRVTAQFDSVASPDELSERWPSRFRLLASYQLRGDTLRFKLEATNTGDEDLPCGLGLHPYFRLGVQGSAAGQERLSVGVTRRWPLHQMLPTLEQEVEPYGLSAGRVLGSLQLDDVFDHGDVQERSPEAMRVAVLSGDSSRLELRYDTDFPFCVLFTPPHREAICIEPYSCLPGSAARGEAGIETGLRVLKPGEQWSTAVEYRWVARSEVTEK